MGGLLIVLGVFVVMVAVVSIIAMVGRRDARLAAIRRRTQIQMEENRAAHRTAQAIDRLFDEAEDTVRRITGMGR